MKKIFWKIRRFRVKVKNVSFFRLVVVSGDWALVGILRVSLGVVIYTLSKNKLSPILFYLSSSAELIPLFLKADLKKSNEKIKSNE